MCFVCYVHVSCFILLPSMFCRLHSCKLHLTFHLVFDLIWFDLIFSLTCWYELQLVTVVCWTLVPHSQNHFREDGQFAIFGFRWDQLCRMSWQCCLSIAGLCSVHTGRQYWLYWLVHIFYAWRRWRIVKPQWLTHTRHVRTGVSRALVHACWYASTTDAPPSSALVIPLSMFLRASVYDVYTYTTSSPRSRPSLRNKQVKFLLASRPRPYPLPPPSAANDTTHANGFCEGSLQRIVCWKHKRDQRMVLFLKYRMQVYDFCV